MILGDGLSIFSDGSSFGRLVWEGLGASGPGVYDWVVLELGLKRCNYFAFRVLASRFVWELPTGPYQIRLYAATIAWLAP